MTECGQHIAPDEGPIRLLVVEDSPAEVILLRQLLSAGSVGQYLVEVAPTLAVAEAALAKQDFNAIILDLSLPDSQGIGTIERLVKSAPDIPIVVLTGANDEAVAAQAAKCGAQDYLQKGCASALLIKAIGYAIDRKQAETSLRRSESLLKQTENIAKVGGWEFDVASGQITWTQGDYQVHEVDPDYDPNDLRRNIEFYVPEDRTIIAAAFRRAVECGEPYDLELQLRTAKGRIVWVRTTGYAELDGCKVIRVFGHIQDITARKQSEAALQEVSERLLLATGAAKIGIWDWDIVSSRVIWDNAMCRLHGITGEQFAGTYEAWERAVHPADMARIRSESQAAMRGEKEYDIEFQVIWPDGTVHHLAAKALIQRDAAGRPIRMLGANWDITHHNRAEAALVEETTRRRILFDQAPDGIVVLDPTTGRFLEFNAAAHRELGYSREEFAQLSLSDVETLESPDETRDRITGVLHGKRADFETLHRTREGTTRNVFVTAQTIDVMGGPVYHCVWRDITDRKELERNLLHAQKMEAIGRLAGGVAHDFRNQLTVIKGYGEMLLRRGLVDDKGQDMMVQILKAADRSTLLTGQLLAFSRKQTLDVQKVNLTELVADVSKAIPRMVGEDVQLLVVPCANQCVVEIDPGQLQQAILNLVANARDAMPTGGQLTIRTSCGEVVEDVQRRHSDEKSGKYASLSVGDTGCGMDDRTVAHLFEPFFTTKEVGKGTGLGLPMVYGFVQQSGGFTDVQSKPGKGSTFTLYFPLTTASPEVAGQPECPAAISHGGSETILVVEDEEPVRHMLVESLRESGYTVLAANCIADALTILGDPKIKIAMLITDVIMPGGSGVDLVGKIAQDRRGMKIIFISGYPGAELSKRGMQIAAASMLTKPCDHDLLLRMVRDTLDETRGPV